jgi:integrase/recombinase XerC
MAQGKQAKMLTVKQEAFILHHLTTTRYPLRDRTMFLLSMKAGLRAKEMASLTWAMVTEADGQVGETLHLVNAASKGKTGGRSIPLHQALRTALVALAQAQGERLPLDRPVLRSERGGGLSAATVQGWFQRLDDTLELAGCRAHSGRSCPCRLRGIPVPENPVQWQVIRRSSVVCRMTHSCSRGQEASRI